MSFRAIFTPVLLCIKDVLAQTSATAVPTGTPIPGDYTGALRPQIHYSPPKNFMNDPNGMFLDANGTYHLYYQYNPTDTVAGNQHWGHATSNDLYHWINQPIALYTYNASSYAFSGSAVVDVNNTSGFFPHQDNGVVAIYTIDTAEPISLQSQGLAYSHDGGYTFEQYAGNPVLDIGSSQFRDPKVTWYQDHWVMTIAYSAEYVIGFFTSPDLKNWTHASNFSHAGLLGLQYECPNLIEIPVEESNETMHVLQVSINPGAPLGGSIAQFIPGTFNGYTFTPVDRAARINDFGKDNYAGQFFYGLPSSSSPVSIAWASNWEYTNLVPTGPLEGWRSAMALPRQQTFRQLANRDWALVSRPFDMSPIMGAQLVSSTLSNNSMALDYASVYSNALYFVANASAGLTTGTLNFTFSSPVSGEYIQAGVMFGPANPMWIDRGNVRGFDNVFFTDKCSASTVEGITSIMGVIDRSIFEFFANDGQLSATNVFYPVEPLTLLSVAASNLQPNNGSVSVAVYALESGWKEQENDAGIVVGNVTTASSNSSAALHQRLVYAAEFS